jgi:hypothetical protein
MIKKSLFEDEIIANMQNELQPFEKKQASQNLVKAVDYLHAAIEILEEKGLTSKADQVLDILKKLANVGKGHRNTSVRQNLPSVKDMMQRGVTLADFEKMNQEDLRARAKINWVLYDMGLGPKDIAQAIGIKNLMSKDDPALEFGNPRSHSSAILKMIEDPLGKENLDKLEPGDEFSIESIASKNKRPKDPRKISDPHTKGLTPEKMVKNLLHHGTEFNMSDDGVADDLLNLDINDADLEVLENDVLSEMDFEDEV